MHIDIRTVMLEKSARIILCDLNKIAHLHIVCILICATTAKAKHTCMCNILISAHQNSAWGKQRAQLALLRYLHFFLALRYIYIGIGGGCG